MTRRAKRARSATSAWITKHVRALEQRGVDVDKATDGMTPLETRQFLEGYANPSRHGVMNKQKRVRDAAKRARVARRKNR